MIVVCLKKIHLTNIPWGAVTIQTHLLPVSLKMKTPLALLHPHPLALQEGPKALLYQANNRILNAAFLPGMKSLIYITPNTDSFTFSYEACIKRIRRKRINVDGPGGNSSPLIKCEHEFVSLFLALADAGSPISVGNGLPLINSLIHKTEHQRNYIAWRKLHSLDKGRDGKQLPDSELGVVGASYWYAFMKRNKDKLVSNKGRQFEQSRMNWTLYRNFRDMYLCVERVMVEAGVAERLQVPGPTVV